MVPEKRIFPVIELNPCAFRAKVTVSVGPQHHPISVLTHGFGEDPGKADSAKTPQAIFVVFGDPIQGLISSSMRVAGPPSSLSQFAKNRDSRRPSQCVGNSIERKNSLFFQQLNKSRRVVLLWSHYDTFRHRKWI